MRDLCCEARRVQRQVGMGGESGVGECVLGAVFYWEQAG